MGDELDRQIAELQQGDHLCLVYDTFAEQMAVIVPYVKEGLARGEQCAYIVDDRTAAEVSEALAAAGIDVEKETKRAALLILTKRDAYLKSGKFDPEGMISFLRQAMENALAAGFTGFRATGEMTWALGPEIGCDRLVEYESLLNNFFPGSRALGICQYNRHRFPPEIIRDVLRTHPVAVLGDQVCPNLYYEPTEMFLGQEPEANRVEWMIAQLRRAHAAEQEIRRLHAEAEQRVAERTAQLTAANEELKNQIKRRDLAEEGLRQTRDYLENLFGYANAPIIVWDPEYRITRFNHAFEHLTGYSADEVIGQQLSMLFPEASRDESLSKIALTSAGQYWESVEIPILCKDGDTRVALWNSANIYAGDGKTLLATIAQGQDITERKQVEEQLRWLSRAVEQSPSTVVITDTSGSIEYANPKFTELTGYTLEEAVGKNPRLLKSGETPPEEYKRLWDTIKAGGEWRGEFHNMPIRLAPKAIV